MSDGFRAFQKIGRLNRDIIVTEKLDGTNAQVAIIPYHEREDYPGILPVGMAKTIEIDGQPYLIAAGSRNRWIKPGDDNYAFAAWVWDNTQELAKLGPGHHFGEWWGKGIQRGYGLKEKRWSLFNVSRWGDDAVRPACCHVVPTLFAGQFSSSSVNTSVLFLHVTGSKAAPGFMKPEGVIVYHTSNGALFKVTCENDDTPKSRVKEAA